MSKMKMVCPFRYAGKSGEAIDKDIFCIGSDCAMWAEDMDQRADEDTGCCGLACSGMPEGLYPIIFDNPAAGGDRK